MPANVSLAVSLASLPEPERQAILASLTLQEAEELLNDWLFWARPNQRPPEWDWFVWVVLAGRGFGKTRIGAEMVRHWSKTNRLVNLIGATADDARDIMIEGESGLLAICPKWERPKYQPSKRQLAWPNGCKSLIFTADEPERLRGKQHEKLWCDETGAWRYDEAWDQAMFGLRLGKRPQAVVTTTPKPRPIIKNLVKDTRNHITRGNTYDNRANLAPDFFRQVITKYEGTRLGRQELLGEILDDNPLALWKRGPMLDDLRVTKAPDLKRIVVGVDPEATSGEDSAETGIIVAGVGTDGHGYVLDDRSLRASPHAWASAAVAAYHTHKADRIVAETNQGGEMVELSIRTIDKNVSYKGVHASRAKVARAEPVAALYEQGRVHHCGTFSELEDQMCNWTAGEKSPDRIDALVWALTELMLGPSGEIKFYDRNPFW